MGTEFSHQVFYQSKEQTSNALVNPAVRDMEHQTIEQQVQEFLKRGGKINEITPAKNVSTPAFVPNLTSPEHTFLNNALKNLRGMFGNELDIKPMPNGKFLALLQRPTGRQKPP